MWLITYGIFAVERKTIVDLGRLWFWEGFCPLLLPSVLGFGWICISVIVLSYFRCTRSNEWFDVLIFTLFSRKMILFLAILGWLYCRKIIPEALRTVIWIGTISGVKLGTVRKRVGINLIMSRPGSALRIKLFYLLQCEKFVSSYTALNVTTGIVRHN